METKHPKKRAVISYDNMSPELQAAFKEKYPRGYSDYMGDIFKVDKPDGTFFYAVSIEIPDAIYLVKIDVDIDDYEKAENELFDEEVDDEVPEIEGDVFPGEAEDIQGDDDQMDD
ncbi:MAG TPA: RNA polymerase I-specific transcription initiation factor RRN3 family protein [Candidatus Coprenecus stercoravium]|uniref:RNA polymerase I-specific transcription initiation factor RRN3 family protein n=1 Tax=Candidatus Coprenecus stercoravium TaxID=2840735 RepID=A0A9D2KAY6_9BACT|nr:RNA polymerase I-specific transcription initiation factor RRN3 family protein [Candidatus Coprenecus stercoravium]